MNNKMYFLTMKNIGEIDKGIQCGHAACRYIFKFKDDPETIDFMSNETWVILNGGTSFHLKIFDDLFEDPIGSMEEHWNYIQTELSFLKATYFLEEDLNNSLSAICFLVPEICWNRIEYPNFVDFARSPVTPIPEKYNQTVWERIIKEDLDFSERRILWEELIMQGENNAKLRDFINCFKLA